jgi:hypothetical protein
VVPTARLRGHGLTALKKKYQYQAEQLFFVLSSKFYVLRSEEVLHAFL